jgi:hypothetical protein
LKTITWYKFILGFYVKVCSVIAEPILGFLTAQKAYSLLRSSVISNGSVVSQNNNLNVFKNVFFLVELFPSDHL